MRHFILTTALVLMNLVAFSQDLTVDATNWSFTYDSTNSTITDLQFTVMNDDAGVVNDEFTIGILLSEYPDTANSYEVESITDLDGIGANGVEGYQGININLNDQPNLPLGTYLLAIHVDIHDDISEMDDDNNYVVLSQGIEDTIHYDGAVGIEDAIANREVELTNFPNPASTQTQIVFTLPKSKRVKLEMFDLTGKKVKTIVPEKNLGTGTYREDVDLSGLPAGLYFSRLTYGNQLLTKKLTVKR